MKPIGEICSQASTELYNELALTVRSESVKRMRAAITNAYGEFIPRTLPQYIAKYSADIFNEGRTGPNANRFFADLRGGRRELEVNSTRRLWSSVDEANLSELIETERSVNAPLFGRGGVSETIFRPGVPKRTHGLCVADVSVDWHVDQGDNYNFFCFVLEGVPDMSAITIRVPMGLRLPFTAIDRIAKFCISLLQAFYSWIVETISDAIRKKAVQLSSQLYRRPRVLIRDVASTLAFSCLVRDKDFVLFDDQSLTGFIDVMESSSISTGISALKLSGILLGEIVSKEQSAIAFVTDKRECDYVTIDLTQTNAYKDDEALRHAINIAWGQEFTCIKLMEYKDATFVLFCPSDKRDRVITYVKENIESIKEEIGASFGHIMNYVKLIEELKLGSIFEQGQRTPAKKIGFFGKSGRLISGVISDKTARDEAIKAVGSILRKLLIGG